MLWPGRLLTPGNKKTAVQKRAVTQSQAIPRKSELKCQAPKKMPLLEAGRAAKVIWELVPLSGRYKEVEACCRYYRNNIERMRYDRYRDQGMQIGSGVVESGCKRYGLRLKRPGTRWSETCANAMLALKSCAMNFRLPDFLDWHARQAVVA